MKIVIVGSGYIGLVTGVCFAELGNSVVCVENDLAKLQMLQNGAAPIFETGLQDLLTKTRENNYITFTNNLSEAMQNADVVFIAVGTPYNNIDGQADLSQVFNAAKQIALSAMQNMVVVVKSTVPVGTCKSVAATLKLTRPDLQFHCSVNPEFLREGSAIADFMQPDRIVVGVNSSHAENLLKQVYQPLISQNIPILVVDIESAEMIKYASNAFLATKITFINEIANLCEKIGGDVDLVAKGMGLDNRIGGKFLNAGPGYGGPCFPKDATSLARSGHIVGAPQTIVEAVIKINESRSEQMVRKICRACGGSVTGKTIVVYGVTFKPNTDDMRSAASLEIIPSLQTAGAKIVVCDPVGRNKGADILKDITWIDAPYAAAQNADAVVLLTEWDIFCTLDLDRLNSALASPIFIDLRNIYSFDAMALAGLEYYPVGKVNHDKGK